MAAEKRQFTLYKRSRKSGKPVYYVQFRNSDGTRLSGKSTGQSSRAAAESWALKYLQKGQIVLVENITFADFSRDFFFVDASSPDNYNLKSV